MITEKPKTPTESETPIPASGANGAAGAANASDPVA
jgi:hypothetical protein